MGFFDPSLHCNKFAAKAVAWFKPKKRYLCIPAYLRGKYLNKLENQKT